MRKAKWVSVVLLFVILLIFTGCGPTSLLPPTNRAPVIQGAEPGQNVTVPGGETRAFTVSATDPDGDSLSYSWSKTAGNWASGVASNTVSWTAPETGGTADITVTVSDGKLTTKHTWKVTIEEVDPNVIEIEDNIDSTTIFETGKVYIMKNFVNVNAQLTIEPGAIVKFAYGAGLFVHTNGRITAEGTADQPIIFTSIYDDAHGGDTNKDGNLSKPQRGDWNRILLSYARDSSFKYCHFYYGGGDSSYDCTVEVEEGRATFENCVFANNKGSQRGALFIEAADSRTSVQSCVFYANEKPLVMAAGMSIDDSNTFHNPTKPTEKNEQNGIFISRFYLHIDGNVTWGETSVPFVIPGQLDVTSGAVLNLDPGVALKFTKDGQIHVYQGIIKARGTAANPIYFTSIDDDSVLGDTLGDGAITPKPGDWNSVEVYGSPAFANEFVYCHFAYGGGNSSDDGTLIIRYASAVIENCTFTSCNSSRTGALNLELADPMTLATCTFQNNVIPVLIGGEISTENSNTFTGNTKNGIFVSEYANTVEGDISWLDTSVPYVVQGDFYIQERSTLTLGDGIIVKAFPGIEICMDGDNIVRLGDATFTAYADDTRGGNTDGVSGTPLPWNGIYDYATGEYVSWPEMYYVK